MQKIISLGYNCEVSFQIEKYVENWDASLFSWAYVSNDLKFLDAMKNIEDVFKHDILFHMPTPDMWCDVKYDIKFHGRAHKDTMFDSEGNLIDNVVYDECLEELRSRLEHLKEKFLNSLDSDDEKIFIRKLRITPKQNDSEVLEFIQNLNDILNSKVKGSRYKLYIVLEKEYYKPEWQSIESDHLFIRTVDYFAPDGDTKEGADHESWKVIFDEILKQKTIKEKNGFFSRLMKWLKRNSNCR